MKYAIVKVSLAEKRGIKDRARIKSADQKLMIMNENELKLYGDPSTVATDLGGELTDRVGLNKIIHSRSWTR